MTLHIAGLTVPGPTDVVGTAQAVAGWAGSAVRVAASLPARVGNLLNEVDRLLRRAEVLLARTEAVVAGAERAVTDVRAVTTDASRVASGAEQVTVHASRVASGAEQVTAHASRVATEAEEVTAGASRMLGTAGEVTTGAAAVVSDAAAATRVVDEMLTTYRPIAEKAGPLANRFVEELSEAEVRAMIQLVDQLPRLTEHIERDICPILVTLDRVGPDINELLEVTKEVRHAITGVPGFAFFRKRAERAEEAPERSDTKT